MNKTSLFSAAIALSLAHAPVFAEQIITPATQHSWQNAPREHFSGEARFARLPEIPNSPNASAIVEFEAGAITDWHTHSHGQYLIVTEGEGRTQEWGKPVRIIKKGDVVWCPPNVKHWHGAGEHTAMSHIAVSPQAADNKPTWLERVQLPPTAAPDMAKHRQTTPLSAKQLAIVPIAALSAAGDSGRLKTAIERGLERGLTVNEIQEIFTHQSAYAGFPRALNGMNTLQAVLKERQARGIRDPQGKAAATPPDNTDYYALGRQTLQTLGSPAADSVIASHEGIDRALKAHLFGYLFARDNLNYVNRELVTVSTIAALGKADAQLHSHLGITQRLGVNNQQLQRVFDVLAKEYDPQAAEQARRVWAQSQ